LKVWEAQQKPVEMIHFMFWEALKVMALALLGLMAAKVVANLRPAVGEAGARQLRRIKLGLYSLGVALVMVGAWNAGYDIAAEVYYWANQDNLERKEFPKAYMNALRAVQLRPGVLRYWRALLTSKTYVGQFASALEDKPALESLSGGSLDEGDAYQFALCSYLLAQYSDVERATERLIQQYPYYVASYILQGLAYTAQRKFPEAERSYLDALRFLRNNQAAVEGLAHAYFLAGDRGRALAILDETATRPFSPEARKRFEALKGLYAQ
jgi:tetratricopeptide (TPR) repeat protein